VNRNCRTGNNNFAGSIFLSLLPPAFA
jgi:hypothetical protein